MKLKLRLAISPTKQWNQTNYIKYISFISSNSAHLIQYYIGSLQCMQCTCQQRVANFLVSILQSIDANGACFRRMGPPWAAASVSFTGADTPSNYRCVLCAKVIRLLWRVAFEIFWYIEISNILTLKATDFWFTIDCGVMAVLIMQLNIFLWHVY